MTVSLEIFTMFCQLCGGSLTYGAVWIFCFLGISDILKDDEKTMIFMRDMKRSQKVIYSVVRDGNQERRRV